MTNNKQYLLNILVCPYFCSHRRRSTDWHWFSKIVITYYYFKVIWDPRTANGSIQINQKSNVTSIYSADSHVCAPFNPVLVASASRPGLPGVRQT